MSQEQAQNNQQTIVLALVVIAVLLAAIVGVLIWQQSRAIPSPTVNGAAAGGQQQAANGGMPPQQTAPAEATEFDPKTATKVPAGVEPEAYVKGYYEACDKGDYAKAFSLLPKDKQASYGDANAFGEQLKGYGIDGYELDPAKVSGDTAEITAWQKTPMGSFGYTWVLVKDGDTWLVKSRNQSGMK